jgi:hypothetical protein
MSGESLDLDAIANQVVAILVSTFDFPEAEARHRINLWKAQQHNLEGQALEAVLPNLTPEKRAQALLQWALTGQELEGQLREGGAKLGLDLTE